MSQCLRCRVSGRVQGVWYRASTRRQAQARGVTGYARNLPDGQVEVLACGEKSALEQFKGWLWEGSDAADVAFVECQAVEETPPPDFSTR
ncbi:acylphosphatase [Thiohalomonas denitrificans]|uniref:acylphosphatase n=1 Tax=Thiohalomonas denitrificans TaxID=415747 RepID=A0A1G5QM26_9GAMM|nr:acylphosphatase [Thiohalomonas denitrificans]SCZ62873.1 acylphosphatase [Thiohalomonas denitrificans]